MNIKHFTSLKTTREFNRVYKNSKTVHTQQFVIFYRHVPDEYRVGVVASKKVGKAVSRNRAKRLLRSHFIRHMEQLKTGHYVLVAKPPLLESEHSLIEHATFKALKRLKALKQ